MATGEFNTFQYNNFRYNGQSFQPAPPGVLFTYNEFLYNGSQYNGFVRSLFVSLTESIVISVEKFPVEAVNASDSVGLGQERGPQDTMQLADWITVKRDPPNRQWSS